MTGRLSLSGAVSSASIPLLWESTRNLTVSPSSAAVRRASTARSSARSKFIYGVLEKQFRSYYKLALKREGITGDNLMTILESRLDNVVFRLGFARTRKEARQTVLHGHITVNGHRVDIPSYQVKAGDVVAVAPKAKDLLPIKEALISSEHMAVPAWLEVDIEKLQGNVISLPTRDQIDLDIQEQLIVELYSK